jgi:hypothetical protein
MKEMVTERPLVFKYMKDYLLYSSAGKMELREFPTFQQDNNNNNSKQEKLYF